MPCEECEKIREQHPGALCGPCAKGVYAYVDACHIAEARLAKVVKILRWLRNEAHAMLSLEREGIIELVAITNVKALEARIAEADAALATAQPEELGPFDSKAQRDRYIGRMMNAQPEEE